MIVRFRASRICLLLVLPVAASFPAAPAGADRPAELSAGGATTNEVTLPTGDRVRLGAPASGEPPYEVHPVDRSTGPSGFTSTWDGDSLYVVPRSVEALIGQTLDREQFNVTALAGQRESDPTGVATPDVAAAPSAAAASAGPSAASAAKFDLTVRVLGDDGEPVTDAAAEIFGKESFTDAFFPYEPLDANGEVTVRVPAGYFSVSSRLEPRDGSVTVLAEPEVQVTTDTTVVLDARDARPLSIEVAGTPAEVTQLDLHYAIGDEEGRANIYSMFPSPRAVKAGDVRVTPTTRQPHGSFHLVTRWRVEDALAQDRPALVYDLIYQTEVIADPPAYVHDRGNAGSVETIDAVYQGSGAAQTLRSVRGYYTDVVGIAFITDHPLAVPTQRIEYVSATPGAIWYGCVYPDPGFETRVCDRERPARAGVSRHSRWLDVLHPAPFLLQRWDDRTLFAQMGFSDGEHTGGADYATWASTELTLYEDGEVIDAADGDFAYFEVPSGTGTYTLEHEATIAAGHPFAPSAATTRWTFQTSTPPDGTFENSPHLTVGYRPETDAYGIASAGEAMGLAFRVRRLGDRAATAAELSSTAWASADAGVTWTELALRERAGARVRTRVPARLLRTDQPLSLRFSATDAAGRSVEQTLIDAIDVR